MNVFWEKFRANFVKIPDLSVVYCSSQFIDASLVSSLVLSTSRNCDKSLIHLTPPPWTPVENHVFRQSMA